MHRPPRHGSRTIDPTRLQRTAVSATAAAQFAEASDDSHHQRLIDEFDAALRDEPELSAEERESVLRQFREALQNAPVQLGAPDLEALQANFAGTVGAMAQEQMIHASDREGLIRNFQEALQPLADEQVRRSSELAARIERDGAEKAGEWLATQGGATQESMASPILPQGLAPSMSRRRRR